MRIIDAHHHLWDLDELRHPWLSEPVEHFVGDYAPIRRNYLLDDFLADAGDLELVKSVHLEADFDRMDDPVKETAWLQALADSPAARGFPHGIVAYADLSQADVEQVLARHREHRNVRGIRQQLNHGPDPRLCAVQHAHLMQDQQWRKGFALLRRYDLSFDLQIWPWQLDDASELAGDFPDTQIILNHTGMPIKRDREGMEIWRRGMRALAGGDNVAVKISGLGLFDRHWTTATIRPFVLETIDMFGADRCLFASNFPVDSLMSNYRRLWGSFAEIVADFSVDEQGKLFHDNAARCYRL